MQISTTQSPQALLRLVKEVHEASGLSLREVAVELDVDPSYLSYLFTGKRRFRRDILIALGVAYGLLRVEIDELLLAGGFPPLGRGLLREYRREGSLAKSAEE